MAKLKEQMSKVPKEKIDNKRLEGLDLDYMHKEIQKIIDNHLKWNEKRSVNEYEPQDLILVIDLLTGATTVDELQKEYNQDMKDIERIYDEMLNKYNRMIALDNSRKDILTDLSQFKADFSLGKDLDML